MRLMKSLQRSLTKVFLQLDDTRPCLEANFVMGVPSISNLDILTSRGSSPKDAIMSSDFKSAYSELNNNLDIDVARRTPVSSAKIISSSYKASFSQTHLYGPFPSLRQQDDVGLSVFLVPSR